MIVDRKDKRYKKFLAFKKKHGFSPCECWNLDVTIAEFVLPRLRYFRKNTAGYPGALTQEKWDAKLDAMIAAFELIASEANYSGSDEQDKIINRGLKEFGEWYRGLWS
jgi:hypothetical protein